MFDTVNSCAHSSSMEAPETLHSMRSARVQIANNVTPISHQPIHMWTMPWA